MVEAGTRMGREKPWGGVKSNGRGPGGFDPNGRALVRFPGSGSPDRRGIYGQWDSRKGRKNTPINGEGNCFLVKGVR